MLKRIQDQKELLSALGGPQARPNRTRPDQVRTDRPDQIRPGQTSSDWIRPDQSRLDQSSHSAHFPKFIYLNSKIEIRLLFTSSSHNSFNISSPFSSVQLKRFVRLLVHQPVPSVLQYFTGFARYLSRRDVVLPSDGQTETFHQRCWIFGCVCRNSRPRFSAELQT